MAKEYRISAGVNLGNTNGNLMNAQINTQDYVYSGSISNIFNDPKLKFHMVISFFGNSQQERDKNYSAFSSKNKEWREWIDDEKNESASQDERWNVLFNIAQKEYGAEFDNHVKSTISQAKQEYAPMFEKLESLHNNAQSEQEVPKKLLSNNGKADFGNRPLLLHNIPLTDKESLEARKDLGIIASEWFGKCESYGECRFCASFTKQMGMTYQHKQPQEKAGNKQVMFLDNAPKKKFPQLTYIIDPQTPAVQELVKLDLWKYARNKESKTLNGYTADEQKFLGQLISWSTQSEPEYTAPNTTALGKLCISGKAEGIAKDRPNWVAIPSGMPSKNIVALQVKDIGNNPDMQKLAIEASEMYGVPLIDMSGTIIAGGKFMAQNAEMQK